MNLLIFGLSITWGARDEQGGWAQRLKHDFDIKAVQSGFANYTSVYCLGVSGNKRQIYMKDLTRKLKHALMSRKEPSF